MNSKILCCAAAVTMTLGCVQQQSVGMMQEFHEQFASTDDLKRVNALLGAPQIAGDLINWEMGFSDDDLQGKSVFMHIVNITLTRTVDSMLTKIEEKNFNEVKKMGNDLFSKFGIEERSSRFFCITLNYSLEQAMRAKDIIEGRADGRWMTETGRAGFVSLGYHQPNEQEKALMETSVDNIVKFTRVYVIWQQLQGALESGRDFSKLCDSLVQLLHWEED